MLLTWLKPADTTLSVSQTQQDKCRVVPAQEAPRTGKFIAREWIRGSQSWVLGNEEVLVHGYRVSGVRTSFTNRHTFNTE